MLVAQVGSCLLAFVYMMYSARYLGPASFGILSFALAFTGIFAVFGDFGLAQLTIREVARDKSLAPKYLANIAMMKVFLSVITFGLLALIINLMSYPMETITVVYLLGLSIGLAAFIQMFYSIFQAFERMEFQAIGQLLNATLILGGVLVAIKYGFSVIGFALLYPIANVIVLIYSFVVMRVKFCSPAPALAAKDLEFDRGFWRPAMKEALPFGLTSLFVLIYNWISPVMLSLMRGDEVVGWYSASQRLVLALGFIPAAFLGALFPVMSRLHVSSSESLEMAYERSLKYLLIISLPIGIGTTILAPRIISGVYGPVYSMAVVPLQILVWWQVMAFVNGATGTLLGASDRQSTVAKVCAFLAILNILLNLVLIPDYNQVGAAMAQVIAEFLGLILLLVAVSRLGHKIASSYTLVYVVKVIAASLLMGTFTAYFAKLNLVVLVVLSALVYFGLIFLFRGVDKTDLDLVRRLIARGGHPEYY